MASERNAGLQGFVDVARRYIEWVDNYRTDEEAHQPGSTSENSQSPSV